MTVLVTSSELLLVSEFTDVSITLSLSSLYTSTDEVVTKRVVRLRGLPFQADYPDLASFLSGLNIIS